MNLHVLSGDSLLRPFRELGLEGEIAVFRECLVDGPLLAGDLEEFFELRSRYLSSEGDDGFYETSARPEIEKILNLPKDTKIFLWFEHELFCQANLWFLLQNLQDRDDLWFVSPRPGPFDQRFSGWAPLGPDELSARFEQRIQVPKEDRMLGSELWQAFSARDSDRLTELGTRDSEIFFHLSEVSEAAAEIDSRPENIVSELVEAGAESFEEAFRVFSRKEPVYGFGDLQVKKIWDRVSEAG
ncbi:MAG TPA: DUF1835 domain-containing protein [Aridibacter sp.]|nr:DUF1835 domain-containing protein [Aridibacter sp.]